MKNITLIFLLLTSVHLQAQDITGQWNGLLKFPGAQLRLVFHIENTDSGLKGTMDSPDQGAKGIPASAVQFNDSTLHVEMKNMTYDGKWTKGKLEGLFKQNGMAFPLALTRETPVKPVVTKPQEPVKPYLYHSEDVTFENPKAGITLAGTLTLPGKSGKFPAVILINGSGPQNRDGEILGHKPFLVLADDFTRKGIAVLRLDDRGIGASTGKFTGAITPDFASDISAGVTYLLTRPEVDPKKIGLVGHSEGGLIAPMIAVERKDIGFIVLLAGPGIPGDEILAKQSWLIGKANGLPDSLLANGEITNRRIYAALKGPGSDDEVKAKIRAIVEDAVTKLPSSQQPPAEQRELFISQKVREAASPWLRYFASYDPAPTLMKVKCPVLALNGSNDLQVPSKENTAAIQNALKKGGNRNFLVKELPGLNHLFQESKTGSPAEYATIEQTFSPVAMKEISDWILSQTKK